MCILKIRLFFIVFLVVSSCVSPKPPPVSVKSSSQKSIPKASVVFPVIYTLDVTSEGKRVSIPNLNDSLSQRMSSRFVKRAGTRRGWTAARSDTLTPEINQLFRQLADIRNRWLKESIQSRKQTQPLVNDQIRIPEPLTITYGKGTWLIFFVHDQVSVSKSTLQQFNDDVNEALVENLGRLVLAELLLNWGDTDSPPTRNSRPDLLPFAQKLVGESKVVSGRVQWDMEQSVSVMSLEASSGKIAWISHRYFDQPGYSTQKRSADIIFDALF